MLNQTVLVGRIIEIAEKDGETNVIIAIPRSYKNDSGEYEIDNITCKLFKGLSQNVVEYCKKGDLIGVKGKLETNKNNKINVVAEKVTFLSSKNSESKE